VSDGGARFGISDSIGPSISCVGFIVSGVCGPSMLNSECPGRGCGTSIPAVSALSQARRMPFHTARRVLPEHTRETRRQPTSVRFVIQLRPRAGPTKATAHGPRSAGGPSLHARRGRGHRRHAAERLPPAAWAPPRRSALQPPVYFRLALAHSTPFASCPHNAAAVVKVDICAKAHLLRWANGRRTRDTATWDLVSRAGD
jgi:hypothetical protein